MSAASRAVRFIASSSSSSSSKKPPPRGTLELRLHVRPFASREREGVDAVGPDAVDVCVAARPRDGDANRAVVRLLGDLLGVPRSRLRLTHGLKSRHKTVVLDEVPGDGGDEYAAAVLRLLRQASEGAGP